jgi:hypothetical protein
MTPLLNAGRAALILALGLACAGAAPATVKVAAVLYSSDLGAVASAKSLQGSEIVYATLRTAEPAKQ